MCIVRRGPMSGEHQHQLINLICTTFITQGASRTSTHGPGRGEVSIAECSATPPRDCGRRHRRIIAVESRRRITTPQARSLINAFQSSYQKLRIVPNESIPRPPSAPLRPLAHLLRHHLTRLRYPTITSLAEVERQSIPYLRYITRHGDPQRYAPRGAQYALLPTHNITAR